MNAVPVLLIEDDPTVVELVTLGLAPQYHCLAAADGPAGLALAGRTRPAAIVLDLRLPGPLDGPAVLAALRRTPATARTPVILFSSLTNPLRRVAADAGAGPLLAVPKAAGVGGLRAALDRCLE